MQKKISSSWIIYYSIANLQQSVNLLIWGGKGHLQNTLLFFKFMLLIRSRYWIQWYKQMYMENTWNTGMKPKNQHLTREAENTHDWMVSPNNTLIILLYPGSLSHLHRIYITIEALTKFYAFCWYNTPKSFRLKSWFFLCGKTQENSLLDKIVGFFF